MILAAALLLWSCGPHEPASVFTLPDDYAGPTGQVVGTVGIFLGTGAENPHYQNRLFFRSMDGATTGAIAFTDTGLSSQESHYSTATARGSVFLLELPPGRYEFYDLKFHLNDDGLQWSYWARDEFSVPFTVEAEMVSYLGSFVAHGAWRLGAYPDPLPVGGYFTVADEFDRDRLLVASVHPDIDAESIQRRLPRTMAPPLVVRYVPPLTEQ